MGKVTPIPNSPDYVVGIINLRGEVVSIVDLRKRFQIEAVLNNAHAVVIVLNIEQDNEERTVGLVVDAVADVLDINIDDMRRAPEFGETIDSKFVNSLGLIDEKIVILLEICELVDWGNVSSGNLIANAEGAFENKVLEIEVS